jgi:single-strand DNA-binding protein
MNSINIVGRLGKDVETKFTTTGKQIATMTVAVDQVTKNEDGSKKTDWFNVVAWGKTAEFATNYLTKGRLVSVSGRMNMRKYQAQDGTNRTVWDLTADSINGLDKPDGAADTAAHTPEPVADDENSDPFADE